MVFSQGLRAICTLGVLLGGLSGRALAATSWIVPGAVWTDTSGTKIDAHGGQVFQTGTNFYWVGAAYGDNTYPNIYSSTDLLNWEHEGYATTTVPWMYRPKMFQSGGNYYIWGQVNRDVQALKSSTPSGGFSVYGSPFTLPPDARTYSDEGVFVDDDGDAYFLTSADSNNIQVNQINGGSSISIGDRVADLEGNYEAPGMLKSDGVYYLIVSSKTGYRPNPNKSFWSTSLTGSWSGPSDIAPESTNTYNSQNTNELKITGSSVTTWIYMGDDWDADGTAAANYVWLPISIDSGSHTLTLQDYAYWRVDVNTGVVTTSTTGKRYEAHDGLVMRRGFEDSPAMYAEHKRSQAVHNIDHESNVTFTGIEGTGEPQWVSIHYTVNNATAGEAHVHVNGEKIKISDKNSRAGKFATVPVNLKLRKGADNVLTFGCDKRSENDHFEARLEGIEVIDD
ncbi:Arabinanase/levansucrase/invertase [Stereum hirsutum FP-91666 SS1]|uniref:Arabinanase/levansucrase/invertase n=1 Tax=Stereum hirsutum (strain FP-91666) TaxID=721885 RepID=UPI000444A6B4|nr:Arabinanase/levansucrase/invertase [Stereum hirsutum FP-91666 SS1]EIM81457.1 Arabinanase/levansucrase/invertase [Stereum hirsutum FP-91666 SS1]